MGAILVLNSCDPRQGQGRRGTGKGYNTVEFIVRPRPQSRIVRREPPLGDRRSACFDEESSRYNVMNKWLLYNAFTYVLTHIIAVEKYGRALTLGNRVYKAFMN